MPVEARPREPEPCADRPRGFRGRRGKPDRRTSGTRGWHLCRRQRCRRRCSRRKHGARRRSPESGPRLDRRTRRPSVARRLLPVRVLRGSPLVCVRFDRRRKTAVPIGERCAPSRHGRSVPAPAHRLRNRSRIRRRGTFGHPLRDEPQPVLRRIGIALSEPRERRFERIGFVRRVRLASLERGRGRTQSTRQSPAERVERPPARHRLPHVSRPSTRLSRCLRRSA